MLPLLACILFVAYLFWTELKRLDRPSAGLWLPTLWMFFAGSRYPTSWLGISRPFSVNDYSEGSPLDAGVFLALIIAGIVILFKRKIDWGRLFSGNGWIAAYFVYTLMSAAWSDDPVVLLKRWIKDLGNPIMATVILSENRPYDAVGTVLRRLGFLFLPMSVVFIRYFPELGRDFRADGSSMFTGIGHQKNDLGGMCLISGIYIFWHVLIRVRNGAHEFTSFDKFNTAVLGVMLVWLLRMSDSQTSTVCLVLAVLLMVLSRVPIFARRPGVFLSTLFGGAFAAWLLNRTFDLQGIFFSLINRDATLTDRTLLWETLQGFPINPIIGVGFMSFWSGDRLEKLWRTVSPGVLQAHNGYLEQYLNLGYVGVGFILAIIGFGLVKIAKHMSFDPEGGVLRLCFVVVAIVFNYTEACFYGINNIWLLLLAGCLEVPRANQPQALAAAPRRRAMAQARGRIWRGLQGRPHSDQRGSRGSQIFPAEPGGAPNPIE